jgi:hypothetical protein
MSWLLRYRCTWPLVGETAPLTVDVTIPPVTETQTSTDVPCTTVPLTGEISVILTGDGGRCPRPPEGVGYGVGATVPELVGSPVTVADPHATTQTSMAVRRTRNGRRIVQFPARAIMSGSEPLTGVS